MALAGTVHARVWCVDDAQHSVRETPSRVLPYAVTGLMMEL